MGKVFSLPICPMVIQYLRSLKPRGGKITYSIDDYETDFYLNNYPRCNCNIETAPRCKLIIKSSTIRISQDLCIESLPSVSASKVTLEIGDAMLTCSELKYMLTLRGRIVFYDALVRLSVTPKFDRGIRIGRFFTETSLREIKSNIQLNINGVNHSELANVLLNIKHPCVAGNVVDAIILILKEIIIEWMNKHMVGFAQRCGII